MRAIVRKTSLKRVAWLIVGSVSRYKSFGKRNLWIYVGAKALVALTWHNKSRGGFSSTRRLQKKKIPILISTIYLSLPLLSECLAPGLPSCLSWHRGWHIQRDQLLGHCQLWAVGTGWHSELGYAPETESDWRHTHKHVRTCKHTCMHTLVAMLPSVLCYGPQDNMM